MNDGTYLPIKRICDNVAGCVVVSHRWRGFTDAVYLVTKSTAVHNSMLNSAAKIIISKLSNSLSTYMYTQVLHSQRIQYDTARIQRPHHHKEHTEVKKKQSILSYPLIII